VQRDLLGVRDYPQPDLPTVASNGSRHRHPVIGKGATPALFVGATTRRVKQIEMFHAFFSRVLKQFLTFRSGVSGCRRWALAWMRRRHLSTVLYASGSTAHRIALYDPAQQHDLRWCQLATFKHGPTVQMIDPLTVLAPIDW
jgi:hypothetical protein